MASTHERPAAGPQPARQRPSILAVGVSQLAFLAEGVWVRVRPWRGWRWGGRAGAILFVIALPVALVGLNLRVLFGAEPLYTFAVERYDVPAVTGIPRQEIDRSMVEIRDYFTNDQQLLRITVADDQGRTNPLFTPREVIHMRDVKQLVQRIFQAQIVATVIVVGYAAARLAAQRGRAWAGLARLTRISTLATLAVAVALGVGTAAGFDRLFTQFHMLSFSNDFWQLDPSYHHLVQMFPFDFWLVATSLLLGMTAVEVLALLSLSWWTLQRQRTRDASTVLLGDEPTGAEA